MHRRRRCGNCKCAKSGRTRNRKQPSAFWAWIQMGQQILLHLIHSQSTNDDWHGNFTSMYYQDVEGAWYCQWAFWHPWIHGLPRPNNRLCSGNILLAKNSSKICIMCLYDYEYFIFDIIHNDKDILDYCHMQSIDRNVLDFFQYLFSRLGGHIWKWKAKVNVAIIFNNCISSG